MSDGGEAEGKRDEHSDSIMRFGAGEYSRAIARVAMAQICEGIGFEGFNESALDSLADIAIRYVCELGKTSRLYANLAGRTGCNIFDIVQGLEEMGAPQGFTGASEVHSDCVVSSGAVREIKEYFETADEVPFGQPVPHFPVISERRMIPSFLQMGETPAFKCVPPWLPAFPDPHTYLQTPVWNERLSDARTDKIELVRQHRKAERSLLSLQQRLICNGSSVATTSDEPYNEENKSEVNNNRNPIFENPLDAGERAMSKISIPPKLSSQAHTEKKVSLLETFAPAIEAMKDGLDSGSDGENTIPEKKAPVFLELKGGKKLFGEPYDLRIRNKAVGRAALWFGHNGEKDEKKRRVEFILRQSLENQHELPQL
ncbi:transcription initiation factor TFIID subunit 8-like [Salvia splendens]|uniref:transcription initiation factor TFIID subunit 8-like n=1 Tax=Salvia splendens TaxID=180675 RepID=UPI00110568C3|nr:transcription initiation factor TFIID subunit 8-like [Salvia splendens]XP_042015594.1 transcription initiation factor TFIID subunit 8-like [Salvia splendens]